MPLPETPTHRLRHRCVVLAAGLVAGLTCLAAPEASDFRVGATREELLASFGAPARQQSLVKTGAAIWGPIEEFWDQVPLDSSVEIWSYPVADGSVELYFIDGSDRVQGTGFAPEGAVFEADP